MNTEMISKIAFGKKPLNFIDYEVVIQNKGTSQVLTSINLLFKGKILTKIKTFIPINSDHKNDLEEHVKCVINNFIVQGSLETPATKSTDQSYQSHRKDKAQSAAQCSVANTLFSDYNL
jgi:hypothetical protein